MNEPVTKRLFRLATTFPTLVPLMRYTKPDDVLSTLRAAATSSASGAGARQAALFCCWVHNPYVFTFDLAKAWPIWDAEHRAAYQKWALEPIWL